MKYKLLEKEENGLCRIQALVDFSDVKAGDTGGYIEREENLSQYGDSWVYDNAIVYGNAMVYGNAWIYDNARAYGNARVYRDARIYDNARVYGNAEVYDNAEVYGNAWISAGKIHRTSDYVVFKNNTTSGRYFTYVFTSDNWVIGCFQGDTSDLIEHLEENENDLQKAEYGLYIEFVKKLKELKNK